MLLHKIEYLTLFKIISASERSLLLKKMLTAWKLLQHHLVQEHMESYHMCIAKQQWLQS